MSRVTIKDVAKAANVSIATVSNVINGTGRASGETIRKVNRIIEEMQFRPSTAARNLKDKKSHLIALVVPFQGKDGRLADNPFYWQLVSAIEEATRSRNVHVIPVGVSEDENFAFVRERHLDGLIVVGTRDDARALEQLLSLDVPCVFMDSYLSDPDLHQVCLDDEMGGYLGTKHLLALGHRRIALLTGELKDGDVNRRRLDGYRRALEEAGVDYGEDLIFQEPVSAEGGYQAAQRVVDPRNRISAVFACSDIAAMGLVKGLHEFGVHVPGDVSVMGFDDTWFSCYMVPALTTVHQDIAHRGKAAVDLLFRQIDGEPAELRKVVLPVSLKVRQSTAVYQPDEREANKPG